MQRVIRRALALAAIPAVVAGAAWAGPPSPNSFSPAFGASALALPVADPGASLAPRIETVAFAPRPQEPTTFESVRYQPRSSGYRPHGSHSSGASDASAPFQIHAGFFEPDGRQDATSFVLGLRGGPLLQRRVQVGVGFDWMHDGAKNVTVTGEPYQQGGVVITPQRVLAEASADVLPLTGFIQVNLTDGAVVPYVGAGGGWQWLFLSARDFQTGTGYDATFGGWTWQAWGGAQLALSPAARLFGEVFLHNGDAERTVQDLSGTEYQEVVDLAGAGMRFGVAWGF